MSPVLQKSKLMFFCLVFFPIIHSTPRGLMRGCCQKIEPLLSPPLFFFKQSYEFTLPKQSVLNLKKREVFLVRRRLLIHNNPANEWADYRGEDEEAVISTWLEWNRLGGGGRGVERGGDAGGCGGTSPASEIELRTPSVMLSLPVC